MFLTSLGSILLAAMAAGDQGPHHPTLDNLAAEAAILKSQQPDRWQRYQEHAEQVFADNHKVVSQWVKRSAPPRPDLTPLKLPLAFLVHALRREERPSEEILPAKKARRQDPGRRHFAYLTAVVHSADERRIQALLEYRDHYLRLSPENEKSYSWGQLLADAAPLPWAVAQIKELAKRDPPLDFTRRAENLLYCLIDRFARELPADAEQAAYAYIRKQAPDGPASYEKERLWDVLFRLDAPRARKEILPYFATPSGNSLRYNYHALALLSQHAGPSAEVATAVRRWLATQADLSEFHKRQLRVILLRADPAKELEPTVKHIDQLLAVQERKKERFEFGGDVHLLVLAMRDVDSKAAADHLARYVFERAIDTGVRFLILESVVGRRYAKSPELVARWLSEEPEYMQRHLKKEATEQWGTFGREVLEKADQLNRRKNHTPAK